MNENDEIYGKKAYTVMTSVKFANIIFEELEKDIQQNHMHEYGCGAISIHPSSGSVRVEIWAEDEDLGDCPWYLLTYHDFIEHCKEIVEKYKKEESNNV